MTTYYYVDRPATLLARRTGQPDQPLVTAASYLPSGPLSGLTLGNGSPRRVPREPPSSAAPELVLLNDAVGNILSIVDILNAGNLQARRSVAI